MNLAQPVTLGKPRGLKELYELKDRRYKESEAVWVKMFEDNRKEKILAQNERNLLQKKCDKLCDQLLEAQETTAEEQKDKDKEMLRLQIERNKLQDENTIGMPPTWPSIEMIEMSRSIIEAEADIRRYYKELEVEWASRNEEYMEQTLKAQNVCDDMRKERTQIRKEFREIHTPFVIAKQKLESYIHTSDMALREQRNEYEEMLRLQTEEAAKTAKEEKELANQQLQNQLLLAQLELQNAKATSKLNLDKGLRMRAECKKLQDQLVEAAKAAKEEKELVTQQLQETIKKNQNETVAKDMAHCALMTSENARSEMSEKLEAMTEELEDSQRDREQLLNDLKTLATEATAKGKTELEANSILHLEHSQSQDLIILLLDQILAKISAPQDKHDMVEQFKGLNEKINELIAAHANVNSNGTDTKLEKKIFFSTPHKRLAIGTEKLITGDTTSHKTSLDIRKGEEEDERKTKNNKHGFFSKK